jgi:hypothetical protein
MFNFSFFLNSNPICLTGILIIKFTCGLL